MSKFWMMSKLIKFMTLYKIDNLLMSSGILLALVRISEPFVWAQITTNQNLKFSKNSIDSFLKSAFNSEYVILILVGINQSLDFPDVKTRKLKNYQIV